MNFVAWNRNKITVGGLILAAKEKWTLKTCKKFNEICEFSKLR